MRRSGLKQPLSVGEVLRSLMEEMGVTQNELARAARISQPYLSDIIRGKRGISAEMACRLAHVIGHKASEVAI